MTHRQIEAALGRRLPTTRAGTATGLSLADLELLELVRASWRRAVAADRRIVRATLAADRVAAGVTE